MVAFAFLVDCDSIEFNALQPPDENELPFQSSPSSLFMAHGSRLIISDFYITVIYGPVSAIH